MSSLALMLEDDLDEFPAYQPVRAMGRALARLHEIADEIGCDRLSDFVAGEEDSERFGRQVLDDIAEHEGWSDYRGRREGAADDEWFEPDDGLAVIRALQGYIESDPESVRKADGLLKEFALVEQTLRAAIEQGMRFRFEEDE